MARPVKGEMERIEKLLQGELTPRQRFALMIAHSTLKWTGQITKNKVPPTPSTLILRAK